MIRKKREQHSQVAACGYKGLHEYKVKLSSMVCLRVLFQVNDIIRICSYDFRG